MKVLSIVCIYIPAGAPPSKRVEFNAFISCSLPCIVKQSDWVICAGHIDPAVDNAHRYWDCIGNMYPQVHQKRFAHNAGKSAYINSAIKDFEQQQREASPRADIAVVTIDCDMIFVEKLTKKWLYLNLLRVLCDSELLHAGIVAPNHSSGGQQLRRHMPTVYANCINLPPPSAAAAATPTLRLYWSDEVPASVAGGLWMFSKKRVYDAKPGGFDDVGQYGPEDALFASWVSRELGLRCYMVENLYVQHGIIMSSAATTTDDAAASLTMCDDAQ